jgi:hypothetical protein
VPTKKQQNRQIDRWTSSVKYLQGKMPHLMSFLLDNDDFSELRIKARDDGSVLAIAKGYDDAGSPVVSFGVGYDAILALMAIDQTIQGGHWRIDKPWDKGKG